MEPEHPPVAHFSALVEGGAAIAARRLHHSLLERGVRSRFLHRWHDSPGPSYGRFEPWKNGPKPLGRALSRVERSVTGRLSSRTAFTLGRTPRRTPWVDRRPGEIVHLHWIAHLLDFPSFFRDLHQETPLVWTLHDMNPFTGGCHYSLGCEAFRSGCAHCPVLDHGRRFELAARNARLKRRHLEGRNLHVVADSRWIETCARESFVLGGARSIRTIHYGLDTDLFRPRDRTRAREKLGVPSDATVVAFGAHSVDERRKGMPELLKALAGLRRSRDVKLLTYGSTADTARDLPFEIISMGFISAEDRLALCYSAADLFVIPSLEEAFGQTALEAISCGIPVVAFDTGGIPDTVIDGETGLLVPVGSVSGLTAAIQRLLGDPGLRAELGERGRAHAVENFGLDRQVEAYQDLYASITD